jgi:hypothetical protein
VFKTSNTESHDAHHEIYILGVVPKVSGRPPTDNMEVGPLSLAISYFRKHSLYRTYPLETRLVSK